MALSPGPHVCARVRFQAYVCVWLKVYLNVNHICTSCVRENACARKKARDTEQAAINAGAIYPGKMALW